MDMIVRLAIKNRTWNATLKSKPKSDETKWFTFFFLEGFLSCSSFQTSLLVAFWRNFHMSLAERNGLLLLCRPGKWPFSWISNHVFEIEHYLCMSLARAPLHERENSCLLRRWRNVTTQLDLKCKDSLLPIMEYVEHKLFNKLFLQTKK